MTPFYALKKLMPFPAHTPYSLQTLVPLFKVFLNYNLHLATCDSNTQYLCSKPLQTDSNVLLGSSPIHA
jgi:hypothetical protein